MRIRECITLILVAAVTLSAQQPAQPAPAQAAKLVAQAPAGQLKIVVVEGEGAQNNIKARTGTAPVVEVRDEADKPVSGAEVVFQLPPGGPGGSFHGWLKNQTVRTDDKGRAAATGFAPNDEPGRFNMKVTASGGNKSGSAIIAQSNISGGASGKSGTVNAGNKNWVKWVAILGAAGVAGGVAAAVRGNGTTTTTTVVPISITAAPITVGGPR